MKNNVIFKLEKRHIPNILTIFRICLVPIIIAFLYFDFGQKDLITISINAGDKYSSQISLSWLLGGILFVIASLTDLLDGWLARRYHWESNFGKIWDPVADKILINSVLIIMAGVNNNNQQYIFIAVPIIMIGRDMAVDAARIQAASHGLVVSANWWGKVKTVTQMFGIMMILFVFRSSQIWETWQWWIVQNSFIWMALFFSIFSGYVYIEKIFRVIKNH